MKTLKTLSGAVALALVIAGSISTPVKAQARPAIVQDRDQVGRNFYYQQIPCGGVTSGYCAITFPPPPAGKRLIITYVSILNLMPAANTIESIDLRILNSSIVAFLKPVVSPGVGSTFNYTVSENILAKFESTDSPQLITFTTSSANFTMLGILAGYTVDIP